MMAVCSMDSGDDGGVKQLGDGFEASGKDRLGLID